jgi:hypothetical protein
MSALFTTTIPEVWRHVANTDFILGNEDAGVERVLDGDIDVLLSAARVPGEVWAYGYNISWEENLVNFLTWLRLPADRLALIRTRLLERTRARRGARRLMLLERDRIFLVRNEVFTKISKEAVSRETEANRLIIARHVEETFSRLNYPVSLRARIREACVNACFINTLYDEAGRELALGPPQRPI